LNEIAACLAKALTQRFFWRLHLVYEFYSEKEENIKLFQHINYRPMGTIVSNIIILEYLLEINSPEFE